MTNIELYQEIVDIVFPIEGVIVKEGNQFQCDIDEGIIYVSNIYDNDFQDNYLPYLLSDLGFKYFNYCSEKTWAFLHELGHMYNGWYTDREDYGLKVLSNIETASSLIESINKYNMIEDEYYANSWAYDFLLKNKGVVKRLEKEIGYVITND